MSYSFTARGATKADVKEEVVKQLAAVVAAQPSHARDHDQAIAVAHAFIDTLTENADKDVVVAMSGGLSGHWESNDIVKVSGANVSVSAYVADRKVDGA